MPLSIPSDSLPRAQDHIVRFYESDWYLYEVVGAYLREGFEAGEGVITIATREHQEGFERVLKAGGADTAVLRQSGQWIAIDAEEMLGRFFAGPLATGRIDPVRLRKTVEDLVRDVRADGRFQKVRAYGEMVDVLVRYGNLCATACLEDLWNDLVARLGVQLCCGYFLGRFDKSRDLSAFQTICNLHAEVYPAETYHESAPPREQRRQIAELQQRGRALHAEVAARERFQETLHKRERELKDFLENAIEGLAWVGPHGTILWANKAELDLLGYTRDEYVGRPIADFHEDAGLVTGALSRVAMRETVRGVEATVKAKDGSHRHVVMNLHGYWEDDRLVHAVVFSRDLTDWKKAKLECDALHARNLAQREDAE